MDTQALIAMAGAFFAIAVAPGPATLGCASVAMAHGRKPALNFALGLGLALFFWGVLAALGLGAVLAASATAMTWLKLAGGAYLLWLAWTTARAAWKNHEVSTKMGPHGRWLRRGILLNLSNPKAIFAWLATLLLGVDPDAGAPAVFSALVICGAIGFAVYLPWVFGFSHPAIMSAYQRFKLWVDGFVSVIFAAAGFSLIRSAFGRASI